jgi:hypothetical protein
MDEVGRWRELAPISSRSVIGYGRTRKAPAAAVAAAAQISPSRSAHEAATSPDQSLTGARGSPRRLPLAVQRRRAQSGAASIGAKAWPPAKPAARIARRSRLPR